MIEPNSGESIFWGLQIPKKNTKNKIRGKLFLRANSDKKKLKKAKIANMKRSG
jgi:hypothetical protein